MRISGLQLDIDWENKASNRDRVIARLDAVAPQRLGELFVLPEMFGTGFSMDAGVVAEPERGETENWLQSLAETRGLTVVGGNVRTTGSECYNEAVAFSPSGELSCRYRKIHPFTLGEEDKHYTGGNEVKTFAVGDAFIAPLICYDLRFPEPFRMASKMGANLMVVIANWPSKRIQHWTTLLQARAIENQAFVIGINRTGTDPTLDYNGQSVIVDYMGEVLADAGADETLISADLDFEALNHWRESFPALRDRKL